MNWTVEPPHEKRISPDVGDDSVLRCRRASQKSSGDLSPSVVSTAEPAPSEDGFTNHPEFEFDDSMVSMGSSTKQATKLAQLPEGQLNDFLWTTAPCPHAVRRRYILEKHPEIEDLYGSDPMQAITTFATIFVQFFIAYLLSFNKLPVWQFLALTYFISGGLNHSLFSAMHEGSHRTIFAGKNTSELFIIACTLPMAIPAAIPFKRYHLDHHIYLGVENIDPDLPTEFEARFCNSPWRKILWILMLPATYSLRPMIIRPKHVVTMDIVAWVLFVTVDLAVIFFWGWPSFLYLLLGTFFSMSLHPMAGHFLSEHFVFPGQDDTFQETHSYYGPWNFMTYNLGHHVEHHDFPRIPGSRLPLLRRIAPEFYEMEQHYGWLRILLRFLFTDSMTPHNRILRKTPKGGNLGQQATSKMHEGEVPLGGSKLFWPRIGKCANH